MVLDDKKTSKNLAVLIILFLWLKFQNLIIKSLKNHGKKHLHRVAGGPLECRLHFLISTNSPFIKKFRLAVIRKVIYLLLILSCVVEVLKALHRLWHHFWGAHHFLFFCVLCVRIGMIFFRALWRSLVLILVLNKQFLFNRKTYFV